MQQNYEKPKIIFCLKIILNIIKIKPHTKQIFIHMPTSLNYDR